MSKAKFVISGDPTKNQIKMGFVNAHIMNETGEVAKYRVTLKFVKSSKVLLNKVEITRYLPDASAAAKFVGCDGLVVEAEVIKASKPTSKEYQGKTYWNCTITIDGDKLIVVGPSENEDVDMDELFTIMNSDPEETEDEEEESETEKQIKQLTEQIKNEKDPKKKNKLEIQLKLLLDKD